MKSNDEDPYTWTLRFFSKLNKGMPSSLYDCTEIDQAHRPSKLGCTIDWKIKLCISVYKVYLYHVLVYKKGFNNSLH